MHRVGKALVTLTAAATVTMAGTAFAFAATSGGINLKRTGVTYSGTYVFYPKGTNHGGLGYSGRLCDTASDGNGVFVQAQVEGYGYGGRVYQSGGKGTCKSVSRVSYDPAALYVNGGRVQACQDRGTFVSDLCDDTGILRRNG